MHTAYLSIGSNIGEKSRHLDNAVTRLDRSDKIDVIKVSSFYKTQPQNYTDQEWFVNAALKIKTQLKPEKLLSTIKNLEKELDKEGKSFRFGPRVIDLDIIYYDD